MHIFLFLLISIQSSALIFNTSKASHFVESENASLTPANRPRSEHSNRLSSFPRPSDINKEAHHGISAYPIFALWGLEEEELNEAFKDCNELICVIDEEGVFRKVNHKWYDVLGWEPHELLGVPYIDLIHPKDVEGTLQYKKDPFHLSHENRFRCRDGSYKWLEWILLPNLKSTQEMKTPVCFARDITLRKESEKQNRKELKKVNQSLVYKEKLLKAIREIQSNHTHEMFSTAHDLSAKNKHTL